MVDFFLNTTVHIAHAIWWQMSYGFVKWIKIQFKFVYAWTKQYPSVGQAVLCAGIVYFISWVSHIDPWRQRLSLKEDGSSVNGSQEWMSHEEVIPFGGQPVRYGSLLPPTEAVGIKCHMETKFLSQRGCCQVLFFWRLFWDPCCPLWVNCPLK